MTTPDIIQQIDALQARYIQSLDKRNMAGWLETFDTADDASYICTSAENVDNDLPLALMMDDCHGRLEDRVTFITKIWAGTFQDYRTRHFIQQISCSPTGNDEYDVVTNFSVLYTPDDTGQSEVLASGEYQDRVKFNGSGPRFLSKKAVTDTTILPRYLVYPL